MLQAKHIAVLGAGGSGVAAATLALKLGGNVTIYDSGPITRPMPEGAELHAEATVATGHAVQADLVVVSPGIDTYGEFVQAFAAGSGELIGEVELAAQVYQGQIIAITGTNGKTTTTEMVEQMMLSSGRSCVACGNYGIPFSEVVLRDEVPDFVALELSSFQLETTARLASSAIIWLNFSADHLDRYPDLAAYKKAKLRILESATEETTIVVRSGEKLGEWNGERVTFSTEESADWSYAEPFLLLHGETKVDLSTTKLRGLHNAENAMAASAACASLGVSFDDIQRALDTFIPPKHRCELICELDGVEYINDSKATNIHALESAIRSFSKPIVLLVGGKDKGLDYQGLLNKMVPAVKTVIVFGEISEQLNELFSPIVPTLMKKTLENAVPVARQVAREGDIVLLSPGTSSFDQFSGYEARGNQFRKLVQEL